MPSYTCNGVSNGGRNFFVGPFPVVEGEVKILAINDPDPSRSFARKRKMEFGQHLPLNTAKTNIQDIFLDFFLDFNIKRSIKSENSNISK